MRKSKYAALCMALLLTGCSSAENAPAESIPIIDAGGAAISEGESAQTSAGVQPPQTSLQTTARSQPEQSAEPTEAESTAEPPQPAATTAEQTTSTTAEQTSAEPQISNTPQTSSTPQTTPQTTTQTSAQPADEPIVTEPDLGTNSYKALNYSEVKAVWISYIELAELLTGQTAAGFRTAIGAAFDNCAGMGINTVYIHVRSHGDAYYKSELYPWSKYVTGTLNSAPAFDPLNIMLEEAHSRGLSLHAWINPLRACTAAQLDSYGDFPVKQWAKSDAGKYVVNVGGTYYLNPAYEQVTDFIALGAAEIAANYDVDGVHIDDYFYPTTDSSFDSSAYSASGYSTLSAFRFANCDRLVRSIYSAVKSANGSAIFGVSCQGSIENNYNLMYADVKKWCTESGYLDYIAPQIYYGFTNTAQPYEKCLSQWNDIAKSGGIPLIAGLSVSKIGYEDKWAGSGKSEWLTASGIISRQITAAMECTAYGGTALYSYRSIFAPESGVKSQVDAEISAVRQIYLQ